MIMFVSFVDGETTMARPPGGARQDRRADVGLQITVQHEDIFRFMHRI